MTWDCGAQRRFRPISVDSRECRNFRDSRDSLGIAKKGFLVEHSGAGPSATRSISSLYVRNPPDLVTKRPHQHVLLENLFLAIHPFLHCQTKVCTWVTESSVRTLSVGCPCRMCKKGAHKGREKGWISDLEATFLPRTNQLERKELGPRRLGGVRIDPCPPGEESPNADVG